MKLQRLTLAALLLCHATAHAVIVFSDDFEADVPAFNQTVFVGGWTVTAGTVDLVQNFFGPGKIVDLDGSTGDAGVLSKALSLTAGTSYTASFSLAGSQRGSSETVAVSFGSASSSYTLASADPFGVRSLTFTPGASGTFSLSFANAGGDNVGALLDNVVVQTSPVPEPGRMPLLLAGVAGWLLWRRSRSAG